MTDTIGAVVCNECTLFHLLPWDGCMHALCSMVTKYVKMNLQVQVNSFTLPHGSYVYV